MTEKRFIIDVEEITQENAVFEEGNCYCFEDDSEALVERLNQYADENEQLKQTNQRLNDELQECMGKLALKR